MPELSRREALAASAAVAGGAVLLGRLGAGLRAARPPAAAGGEGGGEGQPETAARLLSAPRDVQLPPQGTAWFGAYPMSSNGPPGTYEGPTLANRKLDVLVRYEKWDTVWPGSADKGYETQGRILSCRWPCVLQYPGAGKVTSDGTTAPAAGTVQTWTVDVTAAFPAVAAGQQLTLWDPADTGPKPEVILVTAAPGGTGTKSWTVTRGAYGTTPVAHASGFSLSQGGGAQWPDITSGAYDPVIKAAASYWAAWGQPMFVSFCGEFDSSVKSQAVYDTASYNWYGGYSSQVCADFVAAWKHIYDLVIPVAPNIIFAWVMTGYQLTPATASMYPSDAYVDWIGFDKYCTVITYDAQGNITNGPLNLYGPIVNWIKANLTTAKPYGLFETGVPSVDSGGNPGNTDANCATWFDLVPSQCAELGISIWMPWNDGTSVVPPNSDQAAALAAIGETPFFNQVNPYQVATLTTMASSSSDVLPVTKAVPAGNALIVATSINSSVTVKTVTDSQNNLYQKVISDTDYDSTIWVATQGQAGGTNPTAALATTDKITVTYSTSNANARNVIAIGASGVAAGTTPTNLVHADGSNNAPSAATGTLPAGSQTVIAQMVIAVENNSGVQDITWTGAMSGRQIVGGLVSKSNQTTAVAALITDSTASVTASGTIASPDKWNMMLLVLPVA